MYLDRDQYLKRGGVKSCMAELCQGSVAESELARVWRHALCVNTVGDTVGLQINITIRKIVCKLKQHFKEYQKALTYTTPFKRALLTPSLPERKH